MKLTEEVLKQAKKSFTTLREISAALHVSQKTLSKHYRKLGISFPPGRPSGIHYNYSALMKWIRANPGVELPRNYKAVMALTRCTVDEVKTYLYRRRKEIRDFIKHLPDLRQTPLVIKAPSGVRVPFKCMKKYTLSFNRWNFRVRVHCEVGSKTLHATMGFGQFKRFTKGVLKAPEATPPR